MSSNLWLLNRSWPCAKIRRCTRSPLNGLEKGLEPMWACWVGLEKVAGVLILIFSCTKPHNERLNSRNARRESDTNKSKRLGLLFFFLLLLLFYVLLLILNSSLSSKCLPFLSLLLHYLLVSILLPYLVCHFEASPYLKLVLCNTQWIIYRSWYRYIRLTYLQGCQRLYRVQFAHCLLLWYIKAD